jgi:hypothetical protein
MYDSLIQNTHLAATAIFVMAVLYLLVGLVSPSAAAAGSRGTVLLRSGLGIVVAVGLAVGGIAYTHSQPDGPHSMEGYLRDYNPTSEPPAQPAAPAP